MKNMTNEIRVVGRLYDHDLAVKTVKNEKSENFGKEFIGGTLTISVNPNDDLNLIKVHYAYVVPTFASGKANSAYPILKDIIENGKTVATDGQEDAMVLRVTGNINVNEYWSEREGIEPGVVSIMENSGSFISVIKNKDDAKFEAFFKADMILQNVVSMDATDSREAYAKLNGAIFNFRKELLPVKFDAYGDGMEYFQGLETPCVVTVWGEQTNVREVKQTVTENAFGLPMVDEKVYYNRSWKVTGASAEVMAIGDADVISDEEMTKAISDRELKKAELHARFEEREKEKKAAQSSPAGFGQPNQNQPSANPNKKYTF